MQVCSGGLDIPAGKRTADCCRRGNVNVYERDGKYQLYASRIRLDGAGELYERFLALKAELEEMGMFAPEYKKKIPVFVRRLGVVTAPTGAAVRDIINVATRRNPGIQVILYPAQVQGEGAAASVARGLEALDQMECDVIIVGRGGGSIEDLWAFNEEETARAIFACQTPVISAVGHETDTTIADYVADLRAPTPSAAAELAVLDVRQILQQLDAAEEEMTRRMRRIIFTKRQALSQIHLQRQMEQLVEQKGTVCSSIRSICGIWSQCSVYGSSVSRLRMYRNTCSGAWSRRSCRIGTGFACMLSRCGGVLRLRG